MVPHLGPTWWGPEPYPWGPRAWHGQGRQVVKRSAGSRRHVNVRGAPPPLVLVASPSLALGPLRAGALCMVLGVSWGSGGCLPGSLFSQHTLPTARRPGSYLSAGLHTARGGVRWVCAGRSIFVPATFGRHGRYIWALHRLPPAPECARRQMVPPPGCTINFRLPRAPVTGAAV